MTTEINHYMFSIVWREQGQNRTYKQYIGIGDQVILCLNTWSWIYVCVLCMLYENKGWLLVICFLYTHKIIAMCRFSYTSVSSIYKYQCKLPKYKICKLHTQPTLLYWIQKNFMINNVKSFGKITKYCQCIFRICFVVGFLLSMLTVYILLRS